MLAAIWVGVALAQEVPAERVAVLVDRSTSLLGSRWESADAWAPELSEITAASPSAAFALMSFSASAVWAVKPWGTTADVQAAVGGLQPLSHGSECGYAIRLAASMEPAPTSIVVLTDGLASDCDVVLEGGSPTVVVRAPAAREDTDTDTEGLAAWLVSRVQAAAVSCVPKQRHRRELPAAYTVRTTRRELVALDLAETDERWRYCIADGVTALELDERFGGADLTVEVPIGTADGIVAE